MNWRLIPYSIGDPAWNMAVDEAVYCSYLYGSVPPTLRFYGWNPPTLSIGYFQEIEKEINLAGLLERGFGLVRRNTGGRAVLHHHELTYSVVAGIKDGLPDSLIDSYLYISRTLVDACKAFGVPAELHEGDAGAAGAAGAAGKVKGTGACFESPSWYELTVGGRKLVGSAQLRQKGSFLQHGSILIDFSALDLGAVLKLDGMSVEDWAEKMSRKVTSFKDQGITITARELEEKIINSFRKLYNIQMDEGSLTEEELEMVEKLIAEKYANNNWNLLRGNSIKQFQGVS
jgi:lipoyl(octanoyl) transferase